MSTIAMETGTKACGFLLMANCIPHSSFVNCCLPSSHFLLGGHTKAGTEGIRNGTMALDSGPCEAAASPAQTGGEKVRERDVTQPRGPKALKGNWHLHLDNSLWPVSLFAPSPPTHPSNQPCICPTLVPSRAKGLSKWGRAPKEAQSLMRQHGGGDRRGNERARWGGGGL